MSRLHTHLPLVGRVHLDGQHGTIAQAVEAAIEHVAVCPQQQLRVGHDEIALHPASQPAAVEGTYCVLLLD